MCLRSAMYPSSLCRWSLKRTRIKYTHIRHYIFCARTFASPFGIMIHTKANLPFNLNFRSSNKTLKENTFGDEANLVATSEFLNKFGNKTVTKHGAVIKNSSYHPLFVQQSLLLGLCYGCLLKVVLQAQIHRCQVGNCDCSDQEDHLRQWSWNRLWRVFLWGVPIFTDDYLCYTDNEGTQGVYLSKLIPEGGFAVLGA